MRHNMNAECNDCCCGHLRSYATFLKETGVGDAASLAYHFTRSSHAVEVHFGI